ARASCTTGIANTQTDSRRLWPWVGCNNTDSGGRESPSLPPHQEGESDVAAPCNARAQPREHLPSRSTDRQKQGQAAGRLAAFCVLLCLGGMAYRPAPRWAHRGSRDPGNRRAAALAAAVEERLVVLPA